jgi:hypothetical protein
VSVTTESHPGRGGALYIEGAVEQVVLLDPDGEPIDQQKGSPQSFDFIDLPGGQYTLEAGVRPCNGNCGDLGLLTDTCSTSFAVGQSQVHLAVEFRVSSPCSIQVATRGENDRAD